MNNGFEKTIQLFKHASHFDVLYDKNKIEAITIAQEIIQEVKLKPSKNQYNYL